MNYFEGCAYHMTHVKNLDEILRQRVLYSKEKLIALGISRHSIANDEVQDLRDRIFIWDALKQQYQSLHNYVPFYFAYQPPMLYNKYSEGIQPKIILFEVSRAIVEDEGVLFTDGNATIQQLSKYGGEKVYIIPPITLEQACRRVYKPERSLGTNSNCSNFYSNKVFLERLNWNVINRPGTSEDPESKRIRHAEVLVPDYLSLDRICGIAVSTQGMAQYVNGVIREQGLSNSIPPASYKPALFY